MTWCKYILGDGRESIYEIGDRDSHKRVVVTGNIVALQYPHRDDAFTIDDAVAAIQAFEDRRHAEYVEWIKSKYPGDPIAERRVFTAKEEGATDEAQRI